MIKLDRIFTRKIKQISLGVKLKGIELHWLTIWKSILFVTTCNTLYKAYSK
jgi:hypothetical protein